MKPNPDGGKRFDPNFDMRLKYNEHLGLTMQQLNVATAMGMTDVSYRLLRSLADSVPYFNKTEQDKINYHLNQVRAGMNVMQNMNVRDSQIKMARGRYKQLVDENLSIAQALLFRAMAEHQLLLPLRIDNDEELTDEQIAAMMGL